MILASCKDANLCFRRRSLFHFPTRFIVNRAGKRRSGIAQLPQVEAVGLQLDLDRNSTQENVIHKLYRGFGTCINDARAYSARAWACSPMLPPLSRLEPDRSSNGVSCLIICLALLDTHAQYVHCTRNTPAIRARRKDALASNKQKLFLSQILRSTTNFFISDSNRDTNLLLQNNVNSINDKD